MGLGGWWAKDGVALLLWRQRTLGVRARARRSLHGVHHDGYQGPRIGI